MFNFTLRKKILLGVLLILLLVIIILLVWCCFCKEDEVRPLWPENAIIIGPKDDMTIAQQRIDTVYNWMGGSEPKWNGQFSNKRWAIMFLPGIYPLNIRIGYYTTIIGLGQTPDDVTITGNVIVEDGSTVKVEGGLNNFWRSCENLTIKPTATGNSPTIPAVQFAISQAAPLRRLNISGHLYLFELPSAGEAAYTSGGYLADSKISGAIYSGSQQQFLTRNTLFNSWGDSVWNEVFAGCPNAPSGTCPPNKKVPFDAFTDSGPVKMIAEKPYLVFDPKTSDWSIFVPAVETNKNGPTTNYSNGVKIPFSKVYVAWADASADTINKELEKGNHIVFTPGIYNLEKSITVNNSNTVLLGTGMATLISGNGQPCIAVDGKTEGVRVSGLLLQAGQQQSPTLLLWGPAGLPGNTGSLTNPGIIQDVFGRVGGPDSTPVSTNSMIEINQDGVIIDNTWLWVADHGTKVGYGINTCKHGLIVNGNNVSVYGLMSEHNDSDNVLWNGDNGFVSMYQSEFRYDLPKSADTQKIVSFRVADNVNKFEGHGMGAYCFFPDEAVVIDNGFKTPSGTGISMNNLVTVFLKGTPGSKIAAVINDHGDPVTTAEPPGGIQQNGQISYVCKYP